MHNNLAVVTVRKKVIKWVIGHSQFPHQWQDCSFYKLSQFFFFYYQQFLFFFSCGGEFLAALLCLKTISMTTFFNFLTNHVFLLFSTPLLSQSKDFLPFFNCSFLSISIHTSTLTQTFIHSRQIHQNIVISLNLWKVDLLSFKVVH